MPCSTRPTTVILRSSQREAPVITTYNSAPLPESISRSRPTPLGSSRYKVLAGSGACQSDGLDAASTSLMVSGFFGAVSALNAGVTVTHSSAAAQSVLVEAFIFAPECSEENSRIEQQLVVDAARRLAEQRALIVHAVHAQGFAGETQPVERFPVQRDGERIAVFAQRRRESRILPRLKGIHAQ